MMDATQQAEDESKSRSNDFPLRPSIQTLVLTMDDWTSDANEAVSLRLRKPPSPSASTLTPSLTRAVFASPLQDATPSKSPLSPAPPSSRRSKLSTLSLPTPSLARSRRFMATRV
jgi:hypothetical protein